MNIKELIQSSFPESNVTVKNIVVQEMSQDGVPQKVIALGKDANDKFIIAEAIIDADECAVRKVKSYKTYVAAMSEYAKYKRKFAS